MLTTNINNPWQAEGVSILPHDWGKLIPIVGQGELFGKLKGFRQEILPEGGNLAPHTLTNFFVVIGGWGVGKSRVGHEVCLEALTDQAQWVIDGKPQRIFEPNLKDKILPIFLRYSQVIRGDLGDKLEKDNWIASVAVEGLRRLVNAGVSEPDGQLTRNQDRLMESVRKALRAKRADWDTSIAPQLLAVLEGEQPNLALRDAIEILKGCGVERLLFVVDEIEDITDVEREGLTMEERQGIDQALLTVIPRVIKEEELREAFPELSFLLLCSQAVGDMLKGIRAIDRRTRWHELVTNAFSDVEAFFRFLEEHRPNIAEEIRNYPHGLKEAAFFAANRNFGWFNVIMYHAHMNLQNGHVGVPELLKKFASDPSRGQSRTVFDLDEMGEMQIEAEGRDEAVRLIFGLLPKRVGEGPGEMPPAQAVRFLRMKHHGTDRLLFTELVEVSVPQRHLITSHLIKSGFATNPEGTKIIFRGADRDVRFDLKEVLESLEAYAIVLPPEERKDRLLICRDEQEFVEQVRALSPYADEAAVFARLLHGFLMLNQEHDAQGRAVVFFGPAFSFLLRFNRLNKLRRTDEGLLRDAGKNSALQEAVRELPASRRADILLKGLIFAWERRLVNVERPDGMKLPALRFTSAHPPLNLGARQQVTLVYARGADEGVIVNDLVRIAPGKVSAHPILLVIENDSDEAVTLSERVKRAAANVAPMVTVHNLNEHEVKYLLPLGMMGAAFDESDLRTNTLITNIEMSRQRLHQALGKEEGWQRRVEHQGLVLRPIFHARPAKTEELEPLAHGYAAMISGKSYDEALRDFSDDAARDVFKKGVERHVEPALKYASQPTLRLFYKAEDDSAGAAAVEAGVPRPLISLLQQCKPVARPTADLEQRFLLDVVPSDNRPPDTKPRDCVNQAAYLLTILGLLESDAGKYQCVSKPSLRQKLEHARTWLDTKFEDAAQKIRLVHREVGEKLLNTFAKDARQKLKDAEGRLDSLQLDFIDLEWSDLNVEGSDGLHLYESKFIAALNAVSSIREAVRWVLDRDAADAYQFAEHDVEDFETQSAQSDYPLWKRLKVLEGFYDRIKDRRLELQRKIDEHRRRLDAVPEHPGTGEKLFPTQALSLPLELYRRELSFAPEEPQRTISAAGTTLGTSTLGFKLASGKYKEALERLNVIDSELADEGKLARRFSALYERWEKLRGDFRTIEARLLEVRMFFSDAPSAVQQQFSLSEIERRAGELRNIAEEGGMREGTDSREVAGTPIFQLVSGLAGDLDRIKDLPQELQQLLENVENRVVSGLSEKYSKDNAALMKAYSRVLLAQGRGIPSLPETKAATYQVTVELFDRFIRDAESEGDAYLPPEGKTKFSDLVSLCEYELKHKDINWEDPAIEEHIPVLRAKRLLKLTLI
jgi:hypothetical protein